MTRHKTPDELAEWVGHLADVLNETARRIRKNAKTDDQPADKWLEPLLADFATAQLVSRKAEHVLSAYALRTGVMGAARVARLTGVTITAATNRAASKVTREAWPEVFGRGQQ